MATEEAFRDKDRSVEVWVNNLRVQPPETREYPVKIPVPEKCRIGLRLNEGIERGITLSRSNDMVFEPVTLSDDCFGYVVGGKPGSTFRVDIAYTDGANFAFEFHFVDTES